MIPCSTSGAVADLLADADRRAARDGTAVPVVVLTVALVVLLVAAAYGAASGKAVGGTGTGEPDGTGETPRMVERFRTPPLVDRAAEIERGGSDG